MKEFLKKNEKYSIRSIESEDLLMLYEWRNSDRVHSMMLTDHKITWEEHCQWYDKIREKQTSVNFIFEYDNKPIGYLGYNDYDENTKICSPGLYLGSKETGSEAGFYLIFMSIEYAFEHLNVTCLKVQILKENVGVLEISKRLGYKDDIDQYPSVKQYDKQFINLYLEKREWLKRLSDVSNLEEGRINSMQKKQDVMGFLVREIGIYNEQLEEPVDLKQGEDCILFGRGSVLDSVDLVSLIVAIEQAVEEHFEKNISLMDEKAMSQRNSPFRTVGTLADYILGLLQEDE